MYKRRFVDASGTHGDFDSSLFLTAIQGSAGQHALGVRSWPSK